MSTLPGSELNQHGVYGFTGNSTGCRYVHQWMAKMKPEYHCPHLSWSSEMDPNGNFKCDDKVLNKSYHNFTQDELNMFKTVAIEHELYTPSMVETTASNVLPECALKSDVYEKILFNLEADGHLEQLDLTCRALVDWNGAVSDMTATYWGILWSFLIFFRLVTAFNIHRHAVNPV